CLWIGAVAHVGVEDVAAADGARHHADLRVGVSGEPVENLSLGWEAQLERLPLGVGLLRPRNDRHDGPAVGEVPERLLHEAGGGVRGGHTYTTVCGGRLAADGN